MRKNDQDIPQSETSETSNPKENPKNDKGKNQTLEGSLLFEIIAKHKNAFAKTSPDGTLN